MWILYDVVLLPLLFYLSGYINTLPIQKISPCNIHNLLETIFNFVQSSTDGIIHHRNNSIHNIQTQRVMNFTILPSAPKSESLFPIDDSPFPPPCSPFPTSHMHSLLPCSFCLIPYSLFPVHSVLTFPISPVHCSLLPIYSHLIIHSPIPSSPLLPHSSSFHPPSTPFPVVWSVLHSLLSLYSCPLLPLPSLISISSFFSILFLCFLLFLHFLSLCTFFQCSHPSFHTPFPFSLFPFNSWKNKNLFANYPNGCTHPFLLSLWISEFSLWLLTSQTQLR